MTDNNTNLAAAEKTKDLKQKQARKMNTSTVKDVISKGKTMTGKRVDQIDINPVKENSELFKLVSKEYDNFYEGINRKDTHLRDTATNTLRDMYKQDTPGQSVDDAFSKSFSNKEAVPRNGQERKTIDLVPRDPTSDRTKDSKFFRQQSIVKRRIDVGEDVKVWDKPNPNKTHKSLTPAQKAKAKARASAAGRPYPNLVDNMAVAKEDVNDIFNQEIVNELSIELVGKVNKARAVGGKPSKTVAASKTLSMAVRKAWLKAKVGQVKE